jgi:hypothetical protein
MPLLDTNISRFRSDSNQLAFRAVLLFHLLLGLQSERCFPNHSSVYGPCLSHSTFLYSRGCLYISLPSWVNFLSPYSRPRRPRGGVGVLLYSFLKLGGRWGWVVNATTRPLYPGKDPVLGTRHHQDSILGQSSP